MNQPITANSTTSSTPAAEANAPRLMIMAAGTGGHIFPGLAIARTMQARGWHVTWLGTTHGMETRLVPPQGISMDSIAFSGLRGKGWKHSVAGLGKLVMSFVRCFALLGQRRPQVVLGMGGYVTVPGGLMARLRGIPLVLVNADASLLLSNKTLLPLAQRVCFGLPDVAGSTAARPGSNDAAAKVVVTGNPVRQDIMDVAAPAQRFAGRTGPLRIMVVGGSLGAQALNQAVPAALALMPENARPQVVHQSGQQHIQALQEAYAKAGVKAEVLAFIDDMASQYAQADVVICRAGAITVSELNVAGVASILVPLVASTTSHQRDNANWMAAQGAAQHLPQTELQPQRLAQILSSLQRADCQRMAQQAFGLGRRDANQQIAEILDAVILKQVRSK
ncbi:MAG: undecaprenyldiphospho-muramoylpentapeptide beta-N-acetylglucosaminyltransferase [Pseudomonadota bacterium]|jgi:UDP-N-acetylglucosamine--N-acetylmuramyl-(pentapeptide) pyrophosphoryl-undecaprenol N-acetylglucosamine transferase